MGDMAKKETVKKKISTAEKIAEREQRKAEIAHVENETIENITKRPKVKDKAISVRVNGSTFSRFKQICEARGFTVNSCINVLISDFVKDNRDYLDF